MIATTSPFNLELSVAIPLTCFLYLRLITPIMLTLTLLEALTIATTSLSTVGRSSNSLSLVLGSSPL